MRGILYLLFFISIAFQGWANARPQESHCMMKTMSSSVQAHSTHQAQQMQDCDQAMPACCDEQHTAQTSPSSCQHSVDCQSSQFGVLDLALAKPQLLFTAIYTPTLHAVPASFDPSNVWRPPQHC